VLSTALGQAFTDSKDEQDDRYREGLDEQSGQDIVSRGAHGAPNAELRGALARVRQRSGQDHDGRRCEGGPPHDHEKGEEVSQSLVANCRRGPCPGGPRDFGVRRGDIVERECCSAWTLPVRQRADGDEHGEPSRAHETYERGMPPMIAEGGASGRRNSLEQSVRHAMQRT
jgi:hypothetical protein